MKKSMMFAAVASVLLFAASAAADDHPRYADGNAEMIHGGGVGAAKAGRDTFLLMGPSTSGAPYYGDFEILPTAKARVGTLLPWSDTVPWLLPHQWSSVDYTQPTETHWRVSTYFAVNGVYSAWCGELGFPSCDGGASDPDGGYGNNYDDLLEWRGQVDDNSASTVLTISAVANIHSEPGYDGTTLQVEKFDQGLIDLDYWEGVQPDIAINHVTTYLPGEYVGPGADEVVVVWHFESDGAWSDADCSYPSSGAIQLDDLLITSDNGVSTGYDPAGLVAATLDFEDGTFGPTPVARPKGGLRTRFPVGVGDFAAIWNYLNDADPCATNYSNQVAFIDDGVVVPGTGPSLCQTWCYGPNGYIVTTTGGLAGPSYHIHNPIYSPVMAWPDPSHRGGLLEFGVYRHEDLSADAPGSFYTWHVMSSNTGDPADCLSASGENRSFVQYGGPDYLDQDEVVDDLLVTAPTHVQIRLAVYELGYVWGWNGDDGYPAPYFDNVRFKTYDIIGPGLAAREIDLANDGFPANGTVDLADPALLTVRFDMGQNISPPTHGRRDFGDSLVFHCTVTRPGAGLAGLPTLHYRVDPNPAFNPYRDATPLAGTVDCGQVTGPAGALVPDRYFGDLSDGWDYSLPVPATDGARFLFPGDVVHYFISATDTAGGVAETSLMPADTTGFHDFDDPFGYDPSFRVQCLPTILDTGGGYQSPIIFWNDFGDRGGRDEWYNSFRHLALVRGRDYDVYYTNGPSSGVGNGLGGKATPQQLAGYDLLLYTSGNLGVNTIANGDLENDSGQDVQTLMQWFDTGGKGAFMTGDDLAADLAQSGLQSNDFLTNYMNVVFNATDLRGLIGLQVAPRVLWDPAAGSPGPVFYTVGSWIARGGCPGLNNFDAVTATDGPGNGQGLRLTLFGDPDGNPGPYSYSACTLATGIGSQGTSGLISMPYDFMFIGTDPNEIPPFKANARLAARTRVLKDAISYFLFGIWFPPSAVNDTPQAPFSAAHHPNPFNPKTTINYVAPRAGHLSLKIYNVRGQLVRTLIDGMVKSGPDRIEWDGSDSRGAKVASGVYFYEARLGGEVVVNKMALVK